MNNDLTGRQQEIINVSLELIAEGGIQSLTIKNIAKRVGFAESAIYRHYENKIQILLAILDFFKANSERIFTSPAILSGNALEKIEILFQSHFKKFSDSPSLVAVIFSEEIFRNEPELSQKVKEIMDNNIMNLKLILEKGQKNGEIRPDIEAAHLSVIIMGSLRMFVKQWHMSDFRFNITEEGCGLINSIKVLLKS